jgi:hypothetical protein
MLNNFKRYNLIRDLQLTTFEKATTTTKKEYILLESESKKSFIHLSVFECLHLCTDDAEEKETRFAIKADEVLLFVFSFWFCTP